MTNIVACNNFINEIHYSGFTISKVYACGGQLVYSAQTQPHVVTHPIGRVYIGEDWIELDDVNNDGIITKDEVNVSLTPEEYSAATVLKLYDNCTEIGASAFTLSPITNINSWGMATKINEKAFYNCPNLENVWLPCNITEIGTRAFAVCPSLTSVSICNTATTVTIGSNAFYGCSRLETLSLGTKVTSIGASAFNGCNLNSDVTIPASVTEIGNRAFAFNPNATKFIVKCTTPPTLGTNAFGNTNDCPIQIPYSAKDTYLKPEYYPWSTYSSRFVYS